MTQRASEDLLASLHNQVAKELIDRINSGEASTADLNAAIKFLKDNGIEATKEQSDALMNLAGKLPTFEQEDHEVDQRRRSITSAEEIEEKLKGDFRVFLGVIWDHLNLPEPTPVQYDIAQFLQHGPKRQIIQAFRGVGKSWVTSAFVLWQLYKDPQMKIMVVSASETRANDFSIFCKRLITQVPSCLIWPHGLNRGPGMTVGT